jgi:hypothetical protein
MIDSPEAKPPIPLTYGRQAPAWRRKRVIVPLIVIPLLAASLWYGYGRLSLAYERWKNEREIRTWYAAAQIWSEPSTKLKYTENPADAKNGKFLRSYTRSGSTQPATGYKAFGQTPMERLPLFDSNGTPMLAGSPDEVMLFLHARTTSAGLTRLLAINRPSFDGKFLGLNVNQVAPMHGSYRIIRGGWQRIDMTGIAGPGEIRLYAGQADPNDPAKFSIPFDARGRKGWIDGVFTPGQTFSSNPKGAAIEREANSQVVFSIRMDAVTSQPATTRSVN